ncbi:rhomboid-related protein 2 isoform X1 [Bemisia tabaci]|nr:PREDICTED: rhomboid-related protein 2-like isoform X1 [Bemisia tabaci]
MDLSFLESGDSAVRDLRKMDQYQNRQDMVTIPLDTVESHWQMVFSKYDRKGDGHIPLKELKDTLVRETSHELPEHAVRKIIAKADLNQDGYIQFPEFLSLVESKEGRIVMDSVFRRYVKSTIPPRKSRKTRHDLTDGEYEDEYTCNPPAVCMLIVSIIEILIFLWNVVSTSHNQFLGPVARNLIYDPHKRDEIWRYLSYMFVHIGHVHLIVNLLVQILVGVPLEMVHKWWRVLSIYLAGVIAGSLGTSIADPSVFLAGASGGVYAIIAAHVSTIILNWSEMEQPGLQLLIFIIIGVVDIGTAVYNRHTGAPQSQQIGYAAHLAGALAGLLVGVFMLRNLEVRSWEKKLWWIALFIYVALMFVAIVWNIAYPSYFPPPYKY